VRLSHFLSAVVLTSLVAGPSARAQGAAATNAEASDRVATGDVVQNRQAAAQAYDRAASLYVAGQYAEAGQWFMSAYRLAPARAALVQAVRSYQRAGDLARSGTLAVLLGEAYPNDASANELVAQILEEAGRSTVLLTVQCQGCVVEVDGRLLATRGAYLTPA
jgi:Ni/Co efflux regulator RcnB